MSEADDLVARFRELSEAFDKLASTADGLISVFNQHPESGFIIHEEP